ncbi:respiratory nitrate reductase subunit gamma [Methylonatrum kenyense]|uniref:respiratory nitrate reductase subunit gamma n=1 Tax=Methylonatrum kenyense TaxID=455253 RepID=UPI0020BFBA62|nr:respiratory nitrate reductase subunit gamma [Methylonatrum kenyense]MCK8515817.1 respiratory nitrate reductase subunit gamma [Methylonatrum kenyense]
MYQYLNEFFFGVFPYIAGSVFILGSLVRFDKSQYTWRTGSSQMLSNDRKFLIGNNLFHIGVIALFFGHLFGLLTPTAVYTSLGMSTGAKQLIAIIAGGIFGLICLAGIAILAHRRTTDPRVRRTGSRMDMFILYLLFAQLLTGLLTIPVSTGHLDGEVMLQITAWAQSLVTFRPDAASHILDIHWIYKLHMFLGMIMFLIFPFTRLVHIWSVPLGYAFRAYQIVRRRPVV